MKKIIIAVHLALYFTTSFSQTTIEGKHGSYLFTGYDNNINVISKDIGCGLESVSLSDTSIASLSGDSCNYIVKVNSKGIGKTITINVAALNANNGEKIILSRKSYTIIDLPKPVICFGSACTSNNVTSIKKTELLSSNLVAKMSNDFPYDFKYEIIKFELTIMTNGVAKTYNCHNEFSAEAKSALKELKAKDTFHITGITVKDQYGYQIRTSTLSLKVE